jgi:hypothetical protein
VDRARRTLLIERYKAGPDIVDEALAAICDAELDARPENGGWTAREVAHHLGDSEMTSAIRIRRLLAEDEPVISAYDEEEFVRRLFYAERPIDSSLEAMRAARRTTAEILDRLSDEDWARQGRHSESGTYGVETWLEVYAAHAHDHAAQIRKCRELARASHE